MDIFFEPFAFIITACNSIVNNYAFALLFFAIIIKFLLFPLGIKQQKNSIKQAKLRPKEVAIRKKYKGRTAPDTNNRMNAEIQSLYMKEGYNQLSGCLPMLIQLPLLFIIFYVIRNPLRFLCGLSADVITKIKEISGATDEISALRIMKATDDFSQYSAIEGMTLTAQTLPNFDLLGIDLSVIPKFGADILLLIPLLNFVVAYLSTTIIRRFSYQPPRIGQSSDAELSMKIMAITMPLISVVISFTVPAIVGIYWIYQGLLSMLQQIILSKMYKLPVFTEEDYKEAERLVNGKSIKRKKATKDPNRPRVRSLHYIDDDEYNAKVVDNLKSNEKDKKNSSSDGLIPPVKMKEYDKKDKK